ncbi:MAG: pantoate--beta-alanine ligase [Armatimonadetes bacterium]|nr:pantoate--beta-alanine ligase [Armatimonadota bacterium]
MEVVTRREEVRARVAAARRAGQRVGFVPTMGAFHEGHLELMRRARQECGFVVVSLFVNPTQFSPGEDLARYPHDFAGDCAAAAGVGVDLLFAPAAEEVYPPDFQTYVEVEGLSRGLCSDRRPGHFRGVATVVAKLLNLVQPDRAYFGEKDFQQLRVVQQLVRDLDMPVEIVPLPTVREPDGLAMSSRNRYLSPAERRAATALYRGLLAARARRAQGARDPAELAQAVLAALASEPLVRPDYVEVRDAATLAPVEWIEKPVVVAVAAYVGQARLIDNIVLE